MQESALLGQMGTISVMDRIWWPAYLLTSLLAPLLAYSQVGSGTVLVVQIDKDKAIMAADSRMVLNGVPSDGQCKLSAFDKGGLIVGVTNAPKYIPFQGDVAPAWDSMKEAAKALKIATTTNGDASVKVNAVADLWATNMRLNWMGTYLMHPDLVRKAAQGSGQDLTHGIFAMAAGGQVAMAARGITFDNGLIIIVSPEFVKHCAEPCVSGMPDIFNEYTKKTSQRAKDEKWEFSQSLLKRTNPEMLKIVKLVELTIAYDPSGTVGGDIDAVELDADGGIRWFKNPNCPATYE